MQLLCQQSNGTWITINAIVETWQYAHDHNPCPYVAYPFQQVWVDTYCYCKTTPLGGATCVDYQLPGGLPIGKTQINCDNQTRIVYQ